MKYLAGALGALVVASALGVAVTAAGAATPSGHITYKAHTRFCIQSKPAGGLYSDLASCGAKHTTWSYNSDHNLKAGSLCLVPVDLSQSNGAALWADYCAGATTSAYFQWHFVKASGHWVNKKDGKCIRVSPAKTGTLITQYTCHAGWASEKWSNN